MSNSFIYYVEAINSFTSNIAQIILQPVHQGLHFSAGQYVNVLHHDEDVSPLSIACAERPDQSLEFHLFHHNDNRKALDLLHIARQEKRWHLQGPFGHCTVNRLDPQKPIIFLARGTGFAPLKAIIEALIQSKQSPAMHLYWRMPSVEDFYLVDLLKEWQQTVSGFTYHLIAKDADETADQSSFGLLSKAILQDHPNLAHYQVFASGPAPLMYAAIALFAEHGLPRECFFSDVFA